MQRARTSFVALAVLSIACGPRVSDPQVSTDDRSGVAGRDEITVPLPGPIGQGGNQHIRSFDEAKKTLVRIYEASGQTTDLYCGCRFFPDPAKRLRVDLAACGYVPARDPERAARIEWEHAVPAAHFGRTFREWREGAPECVDAKGKAFKGRKCAGKSPEFARMEGDLHNLFPVVGEVNGLRSDLPMGILDPPGNRHPAGAYHFGACTSAIEDGVFVPRPEVRGDLARAYRYMDAAYPERQILDEAHRALFRRWDEEDPPDAWERERNGKIAERQGNPNPFIH